MDLATLTEPLGLTDEVGSTICALPNIPLQFFIPRLDERPQNPIMDALRLAQNRPRVHVPSQTKPSVLPLELQVLAGDVVSFEEAKRNHLESVWQRAVSRRHGYMVCESLYQAKSTHAERIGPCRTKYCLGMLYDHPLIHVQVRLRSYPSNPAIRSLQHAISEHSLRRHGRSKLYMHPKYTPPASESRHTSRLRASPGPIPVTAIDR